MSHTTSKILTGWPSSVQNMPILSLNVDPGETITRHGCGVVANGDLLTMRRQLIQYWEEDESFHRASMSISNYIREYHELDARVEELRAEILDLDIGG